MIPRIAVIRTLLFAVAATSWILLGTRVAARTPIEPQAPQSLTGAERARRLGEIRAGIAKTVARLERQLAKTDATPTVRDLPNGALAVLQLGQDPRDAESLLRRAFAVQDMDPNSPGYSSFPWQIGHPEIHDDNSVEFATQAIGPILLHYGDRLSPAFRQEMAAHIRAAFAALRRRNFRTPAYTNIYLMRAVNMILMGEAVGDKAAADEGYAQLEQWIEYTRRAGIHEFDSPTYYATDLNSLGLGYRYAARPEGRARFKTILDYFWTDIAANFFAGRDSLSGPHSRDYDFLRGGGGLDLYLYMEGLRPAENTQSVDLEKTAMLENEVAEGYHPGPKILALTALPERNVLQRWDTAPNHDRINYVTPDYALGSANGDYGAQDKLVSIELASRKDLPVISIVPDTLDAPYGKAKQKDRSGHSKPVHLPLRPATVQDRGALLALLDLDAGKLSGVTSLATNVLLPAHADEITLDGKPIAATSEFEARARRDSVIGVRAGNAGVAIRVFRADGCGGQDPAFFLKADAAGLADGVARLAVYHYRGPERDLTDRHVRVGLLFLCARCDDKRAFAELQEKAHHARLDDNGDAHTWQVTAQVGDLSLTAFRDLDSGRILTRRIDGHDVPTALLSVNGQDLASRVWMKELDAATPTRLPELP